jgi:hypothetical protein
MNDSLTGAKSDQNAAMQATSPAAWSYPSLLELVMRGCNNGININGINMGHHKTKSQISRFKNTENILN